MNDCFVHEQDSQATPFLFPVLIIIINPVQIYIIPCMCQQRGSDKESHDMMHPLTLVKTKMWHIIIYLCMLMIYMYNQINNKIYQCRYVQIHLIGGDVFK